VSKKASHSERTTAFRTRTMDSNSMWSVVILRWWMGVASLRRFEKMDVKVTPILIAMLLGSTSKNDRMSFYL
jgi:hypothetical protein